MADWPYSTQQWQRLRALKLRTDPLCACGKIANTVDHITPISKGGDPFPGLEGLTSYCAPCHSRKTKRIDRLGAGATSKPHGGCDANGNPLDPKHWWAKP